MLAILWAVAITLHTSSNNLSAICQPASESLVSSTSPKPPGRTVHLDGARVAALMSRRGVSVEELAGRAEVSPGTINNVLNGRPVYRATALSVASALGAELASLLREQSAGSHVETLHEYLLAEVLTDWLTASNGLRFQVCRLRHIELDRLARGKRFDLRDLPTEEQQRCRTWIKRHPDVCEQLGPHPNIARNLTAFHDPADDFYWVIDEWTHGTTLAATLRHGSMPSSAAARLLGEVACGLSALHEQGIIRRELSPASILQRQTDGTAILTDFELAKLVDRGPTVSTGDWPTDPYRAPEADGEDVTVQADLYSWARIAVHCLAGTLPIPGDDVQVLAGVSVPDDVRALLASCLSLLRSGRPRDFSAVLPVVEAWRQA